MPRMLRIALRGCVERTMVMRGVCLAGKHKQADGRTGDAAQGIPRSDPQGGHEFSAVAGFTYNFINPSTDYHNGIDFHLDWGQFVTKQWQIGLVGYFSIRSPATMRRVIGLVALSHAWLASGQTVALYQSQGSMTFKPQSEKSAMARVAKDARQESNDRGNSCVSFRYQSTSEASGSSYVRVLSCGRAIEG